MAVKFHHAERRSRFSVFFLWFGMISVCFNPPLTARALTQVNQETTVLVPGVAQEREIAGGQQQTFKIALESGKYFEAAVDQRGVDVTVELFAPNGNELRTVNSPNEKYGPEPIYYIAEATGEYLVRVSVPGTMTPPGRYEILAQPPRDPTPQDRVRISARIAFDLAQTIEGFGGGDAPAKALNRFEEARGLWQSINEPYWQAITLEAIAAIRNNSGTPHEAITAYEEALALYRQLSDRRREAEVSLRMGNTYGKNLGDQPKALSYLDRALQLWHAIGDPANESRALTSIGNIYNRLGENNRAIEFHDQAIAAARAAHDQKSEATVLLNMAGVWRAMGESQQALDALYRALPILVETKYSSAEASARNMLGLVYLSLGEYAKALEFFNGSLEFFGETNAVPEVNALLANIAYVYSELGDHQKAIDTLEDLFAHLRVDDDPSSDATILGNLGVEYHFLDQRQKALDFFQQSLALSRAIGDQPGIATTLTNLGDIYAESGDQPSALEKYAQAQTLFHSTGQRAREAATLGRMARIEVSGGEFEKARAEIETAITMFESLRLKIANEDLRASYFATVNNYYELYIDILMSQHRRTPGAGYDAAALQVSERGRARSLLETLMESGADIRQGVEPKLLEQERDLQQALNDKALELMNLTRTSGRETQVRMLSGEIDKLTAEFQQVEAEIRRSSKSYADLTQPQPLSLKEIQTQVLDKDTLLLEYSLGEERSYLWAVTSDSLKSYILPKGTEIDAAANRLYDLLNARNAPVTGETPEQRVARVAAADGELPAASRALSKIVLAPVAGELGKKRLVIVADGALQYVPFAALTDPVSPAGSPRPLVIDHEIACLPSASTLAVIRREVAGRQPAPKMIAALADPVFMRSDDRFTQRANGRSTSASLDGKLNPSSVEPHAESVKLLQLLQSVEESGGGDGLKVPRLPGSGNEAKAIVALAPRGENKLALDFAASRELATSAELSQDRYIHFSTHGYLDDIHPELSGLVFSLINEKGEAEDGFLRANETYNLKLSAELVVLSACETGIGKEVKGEGLVSLTRGFMYAGAPRVVVSLWSVSDEGTGELMVRFYRSMLTDGLRPAAALRAAQISLMKEKRWASAFYWAPFVLQGEWR